MHKYKSAIAALGLGALLLASGADAQQTPPRAAAKKAMFWKVTSPTSTVYLLGSIHLGDKSMYPLAKEIEDAFAASSALLVEADIRKVDQAKMQSMVMQKGMYQGDDNLWNHVGANTKKAVEQFCSSQSIPAEMLSKFKPWVAALTIATIPMLKAGMDPGLGIDKYFLDKAGDRRVVEIESVDWQIDLFSGFSDALQDKLLAASAEEAEDMVPNMRKLQDAWKTGDAAGTEKLIREQSKTPSEIDKIVLTDRNPHMADAAEKFLKGKETAFLVVGAAHMIGRDGVAAILEKRGYKVEQVALQ